MEVIKKRYITNEKNRKIGVQLDISTYLKIEEVLENYGLVQLMKGNEGKETLDGKKAKEFYKKLDKSN
ncbi:MAG TPA: hypothetical protein VMV32_00865 [Ignavibacteriaceae bacterium]|nr:hypothetical protein [Ignavibacteriaceae bacterium]